MFVAVFILAATDGNYEWLKVALMIVSLVMSTATTIGLFLLGRAERERCRKEDAQAAAIKAMEAKLEASGNDGKVVVEKLLEERLRAASHEVNNHVQVFVGQLETLRERATEWSEEIRELGEADHEQKLSLSTQIGGLKDFMRETFANKEDLRAIDGAVRKLENQVAVLADRSA